MHYFIEFNGKIISSFSVYTSGSPELADVDFETDFIVLHDIALFFFYAGWCAL